jgi:8-oxo-dGTP diphosphatase
MPHDDPPQFGEPTPGLIYRDRPSAFGICPGEAGTIAVVRIHREDGTIDHDLPGGALDEGETEVEALAREFREESGLRVTPGPCFARANQYVPDHTSGPVNNFCGFYEVRETGPRGDIQEPDHDLVWLPPETAAARMYKEAAAWAVRRWLLGRNARAAGPET